MVRRVLGASALVVVVALGASACSSDSDKGVTVKLSEFKVAPSPTSESAGSITFMADNIGGEVHEMVLAKTDGKEIPTKADGSADEKAFGSAGIKAMGEVEDVAAGKSKDLTKDLQPGTYTLFCNIVTKANGETVSHYAKGMHATFTVK